MARMIETTDVREGDLVSFRRYADEFEVREMHQPEPGAVVEFEVETPGGDDISIVYAPADEGVIVRLRDGRPFGNDDMLHARTMRWS